MATRYDLDDITRRAEEAHQQRLAALRDTVSAADAVADAEAQLVQLRSDLDTAVALAVDAGWNESELASFGLPTASPKPTKKRTSTTRRRNSSGSAATTPARETSRAEDAGTSGPEADQAAA